MRRVINQYGVRIMVAVVAVALLVTCYSLQRVKPPGGQVGTGQLYYIDEETGKESVGKSDAIPPLVGKNGHATVVQAFKYDFGDGAKTAFLFKYSPRAQAQLATLSPDDPLYREVKRAGGMVRTPEKGSGWVAEGSEEGQRITDVHARASGKVPQAVLP